MKIADLAKQLKMTQKNLRKKVAELGFKVKVRDKEIKDEDAKKIVEKLEPPEEEAKKETKSKEEDEKEAEVISVPKTIMVRDFSEKLSRPVTEVISALMKNGVVASINEEIDFETAVIIAEDFGFKVEREVSEKEISREKGVRKELQEVWQFQDQARLKKRPPVATVMGHVDHGKTTLLDAIRETNVVAGEAGGITQHIGAYQVREKGKLITFLDTPGHEAFTAMRERGARVTDVAILIVAADDGVKPQTVEAIKHIKEAKIPIIVAINKIDKPEADAMKVKKELADHGVLTEEWGGKTVCVEISAKQKKNINELLDMILLVAEMEELKADSEAMAIGTVIESHKTAGKGIEATVLVQNGVLHKGDAVIVGNTCGSVRSIEDAQGRKLEEAFSSAPVRITGLSDVPLAGDILRAEKDLKTAKAKVAKLTKYQAKTIKKEEEEEEKKIKKLNIVLKADVQGSLEAVMEQLAKLRSEEVENRIINYGVGKITESDIMMAASANALVLGFGVTIFPVAKRIAEEEEVEYKIFKVIYELVDEVLGRLNKMIEPEIKRKKTGKMRVKAIFFTEKGRMIIGGDVISGHLEKDSSIKAFRGDKEIGEGKLMSLQAGKVDVDKVEQGKEAGISFEGSVKIKEGDVLENWKEEKIKKSLKIGKK